MVQVCSCLQVVIVFAVVGCCLSESVTRPRFQIVLEQGFDQDYDSDEGFDHYYESDEEFDHEMGQQFDHGLGPEFDYESDEGFDDGLAPGFDHGLDQGFDHGLDQGFDHGLDQGFDHGLDQGFDRGLDHQRTKRSNSLPGEFPYQAAIYDLTYEEPALVCGATVYTDFHVVTSASCVYRRTPAAIQVVVGDHDSQQNDGSEHWVLVNNITVHELYNIKTHINDIAILHLQSPLSLWGPVNSARHFLPTSTANGTCHLSGWGFATEDGVPITKLQKLSVNLLPYITCQSYYGVAMPVYSSLCVARPNATITSCSAVGGNPLTCYTADGVPLWAGVLSSAMYCNRPTNPWLYSDVIFLADWIDRHVNASLSSLAR